MREDEKREGSIFDCAHDEKEEKKKKKTRSDEEEIGDGNKSAKKVKGWIKSNKHDSS